MPSGNASDFLALVVRCAYRGTHITVNPPKPFKIFSYPQGNPNEGTHWCYWMKIVDDEKERDLAEHNGRALLMRHSPELLNELKAAFGILLQVLDHQRAGKPLPKRTAVRHVAMDALNVIDLAEGRKTEGTRYYPPTEDG